MPFDLDKIKNIAKDVSKEVVNVVGEKYAEIKANSNFDDGKYDEVIKTANEILKLDKFNYEIVLLKGKALMKQNKYDEAIEAFIEALAIDDTKIEPLFHIASINEIQGNIDDAIDVYTSIMEKDNSNAAASLALARNYFDKKEYEKANNYFTTADPLDDEDYYKWGLSLKEMGEFKKAKYKIEKANNINSSREYRQELINIEKYEFEIEKEKAHEYFNNNMFSSAIECFSKLRNNRNSKFNDEDYYIWGLCLEKEGRDLEAYEKFKTASAKKYCDKYKNKRRAIEQKYKKVSDEYVKIASQAYENKQYGKAKTYYSKASELEWDTLTHDDYYRWGLCLFNTGNEKAAKNKFKKANSLKPCAEYRNAFENELLKTTNTQLLLNEATKAYNNKHSSEALKFIDRVLELDSKNIKALLLKGDILIARKNKDGWNYYEKVLEINPNNEKAKEMLIIRQKMGDNAKIDEYWFNIGVNELQYGHYFEAKKAFNKSLEVNPNNAVAWSNLCVLYQNEKNYPAALDAINKSLKIDSKNAQAWFNKGDVLFWMGDFRTSIQCFNQAIRLDPKECDDALAIKGMAFVKLNKMPEAKDSLRECLEMNPKNALALEAIKHIPNFVNTPVLDIHRQGARKINVNPVLFAKITHILVMVDMAKDKGVQIHFEYNYRNGCKLKHDNKEYFFNYDELDGAIVYVNKIQREAMWNDMSDESKDEINNIISDAMKKHGYL